ncbi:16S rRNA (cytosine(1402)-N(4))-methyltransferase RsmH [Buchnera aphidicola]|uniref:Ribosomal RNA small subunit methyltransferase H n=1 Tax=Buchnera aphidicola (Stegophylla sp.) TaxID=2315800 RepID=A0A4D6YL12_9GAMM|nr:16S rRNA (cytosine(1402)-N(4))-methyltransferase RsmH [Buchnera aphidicola (Stegophylla sp.)]QCI26328.1 16S rRNA (cytosine(1402)-N(4))-methyltransferase RsmH [Buchnera aphidicola (Stegophylla sp.)]
MKNQKHITVLLHEAIKYLNIKKNGIYIDGTFGGGGHSLNILKHLGKQGKLYSFDQDPYAINIAKKIFDSRFHIIQDKFSNITMHAKNMNIYKKIDGILLDLGPSSMQLFNPQRGFSFRINGPLDMRMNPCHGTSAKQWINTSNQNTIAYILKTLGEEKYAKKIANKIVKIRNIKPINTTQELSAIIQNIVPYNKYKHPARRSFQAIRIFINQELYEIKTFLQQVLNILNSHGKIVIISFHSIEDRIIKKFMIQHSQNVNIPYNLPITENKINQLNIKKIKNIKRIFPSPQEMIQNPRSRSAILRTAQLIE